MLFTVTQGGLVQSENSQKKNLDAQVEALRAPGH
jgi:hypothetical protein